MLDEGMLSRNEALLYEAFEGERTLSSRELRARSGLKRGSAADGAMTRLQMKYLMLTTDFDYDIDASGKPYGWGVARYARTDGALGEAFVDEMQRRTVEESRALLIGHLTALWGAEHEKAFARMIG